MLGLIVTSLVLVAVVILYNALKSMRKCDLLSLGSKIMHKMNTTRLITLFPKSTKCRGVKASNGHTLFVGNPMFVSTLEEVLKLKARDDDVFIATYPKAGTTWMQQLVWLICNDADIETSRKTSIPERSPFLEAVDAPPVLRGIQSVENWPINKQRIIKTHYPFDLLPEEVRTNRKGKIIYVARNPKDLCVSYYFFHKMGNKIFENPGTWSEFLSKFSSGNIEAGSWFDHNLKYWKEFQKDKERIYFVTYESLKKDLKSEVKAISKFLDKELTNQQVQDIIQECSFDTMSKNINPALAKVGRRLGMNFSQFKFMRKGQVGDWKNYFTLNQNIVFDHLYEEKMEGTELDFLFELE
uniref:sulfotransferase family cytosolic 1B member 1-like n=1 Tax=Styela clava TaxID=7725 RepID=UPI00193A71E5|nr:sulfotransferase family cytosolic 1B member 1-like [Styela clava]